MASETIKEIKQTAKAAANIIPFLEGTMALPIEPTSENRQQISDYETAMLRYSSVFLAILTTPEIAASALESSPTRQIVNGSLFVQDPSQNLTIVLGRDYSGIAHVSMVFARYSDNNKQQNTIDPEFEHQVSLKYSPKDQTLKKPWETNRLKRFGYTIDSISRELIPQDFITHPEIVAPFIHGLWETFTTLELKLKKQTLGEGLDHLPEITAAINESLAKLDLLLNPTTT